MVKRSREGLSPVSAIAVRLNRGARLRFAGARVTGPDYASAWNVAFEIANGAYKIPGLTPQKGDRVVDVGANIGLYSLWATKKGATVTAYEPGVEAFRHLSNNIAGRSIRAVHAAVSGKSASGETVRLYLHSERSTRHTVTGYEIGSGKPLEDYVTVPAVTLSSILEGGCDLLKIDCEGAEFEMIENTPPAVLAEARRIVLEFHKRVGSGDALLARLRAAGFDAEVINQDESFGVIGASRQAGSDRTGTMGR